jgi:hypothetical protein
MADQRHSKILDYCSRPVRFGYGDVALGAALSVVLPMVLRLIKGLLLLEPAQYEIGGWNNVGSLGGLLVNLLFHAAPYFLFGVLGFWMLLKSRRPTRATTAAALVGASISMVLALVEAVSVYRLYAGYL